jgi:hypothetical protein
MKSVITFGMAVVLASTLAAPGFAAGSSEQAREANTRNQAEPSSQTTTPWSSTMSSANTPSHDGNTQPGKRTDQQNKDNNAAATSSCGTAC